MTRAYSSETPGVSSIGALPYHARADAPSWDGGTRGPLSTVTLWRISSEDELEQHLRDQIAFIRASAKAFDSGHEAEAKRLAVAIRCSFTTPTSRTHC